MFGTKEAGLIDSLRHIGMREPATKTPTPVGRIRPSVRTWADTAIGTQTYFVTRHNLWWIR